MPVRDFKSITGSIGVNSVITDSQTGLSPINFSHRETESFSHSLTIWGDPEGKTKEVEMDVYWHELSFPHTCGDEGDILKVSVSRDGCLRVNAFCFKCDEEYVAGETFISLIGMSVLSDFMKNRSARVDGLLQEQVK